MKLKLNLSTTALAAVCALALNPATLLAANPHPHEERGTIKSVDTTAHTLTVTGGKDNSEHKFQWNDQSKFTERGKTVTAADLKAGERIRLTYKSGTDMPTIERARLAPAKAEKSAAASPRSPKGRRHAHV